MGLKGMMKSMLKLDSITMMIWKCFEWMGG